MAEYPNPKSINMSIRINDDLKKEADSLFKKLGINTSSAINMFLTQCVRDQALPFYPSMNSSNQKILNALKEVEEIESGKIKAKRYKNFEDALKDLNL